MRNQQQIEETKDSGVQEQMQFPFCVFLEARDIVPSVYPLLVR